MKHAFATLLLGLLLYLMPTGYRLLQSRVIIPGIASRVVSPARVYASGDYGDLTIHGLHIPYAIVVVHTNDGFRSETYYSQDGTTVDALYESEKLKERVIRFHGRSVRSLPELFGVLLLVATVARSAVRFAPSDKPAWDWKQLTKGERIAIWYGCMFFLMPLLFRVLGLWFGIEEWR